MTVSKNVGILILVLQISLRKQVIRSLLSFKECTMQSTTRVDSSNYFSEIKTSLYYINNDRKEFNNSCCNHSITFF